MGGGHTSWNGPSLLYPGREEKGAKAREETGMHKKRGLRKREPGTGGSSQPQIHGVCGADGTDSLYNQKSRTGVQMMKDGHPRGGHSGSREDELGRKRSKARFWRCQQDREAPGRPGRGHFM